jgi:phosphoribosylglycinamide formyltransferase-1
VHDDDDLDRLRARILEEEHRILPRAVELIARAALQVDGRRVLGTEPTARAPSRRDEG